MVQFFLYSSFRIASFLDLRYCMLSAAVVFFVIMQAQYYALSVSARSLAHLMLLLKDRQQAWDNNNNNNSDVFFVWMYFAHKGVIAVVDVAEVTDVRSMVELPNKLLVTVDPLNHVDDVGSYWGLRGLIGWQFAHRNCHFAQLNEVSIWNVHAETKTKSQRTIRTRAHKTAGREASQLAQEKYVTHYLDYRAVHTERREALPCHSARIDT